MAVIAKLRKTLTNVWQDAPKTMFFVLILHAPYWLTSPYYSLSRPLFSLDLIIGAMLAARWPRWGWLAVLTVSMVDQIVYTARVFHFNDLSEWIGAARFAHLVNVTQVLFRLESVIPIIQVICVIAISASASRLVIRARSLAVISSMLILLDILNGSASSYGLGNDSPLLRTNILGSPTVNLVHSLGQSALSPVSSIRIDSTAYNDLANHFTATRGASSMLILVESLGLPQSEEDAKWLLGRLDTPAIRDSWTVHYKTDVFNGATTAAEFRTLCSLSVHYSHFTAEQSDPCLPRQFTQTQAFGLHGFTLNMFDRARWWPSVGLTPVDIYADESQPIHGCNIAFPGVCDQVMLARAIALAKEPNRFVYALTLDTHLPPHGANARPVGTTCASKPIDHPACIHFSRLAELLSGLATQLEGLKGRDVFVVVSGDHAPPFLSADSRSFFNSLQVPVVTLAPHGGPRP